MRCHLLFGKQIKHMESKEIDFIKREGFYKEKADLTKE